MGPNASNRYRKLYSKCGWIFLILGKRSIVAELPFQCTALNPLLGDESPIAIDATILEQIPFTEQHPVALKDLTKSFRHLLSHLRIPITNVMQNALELVAMGANGSGGEVLEQRRSKPKHKSSTQELRNKSAINTRCGSRYD